MSSRVVIAGFGDTGLLVAIYLGPGHEIVGVSPKPCLVSGQELGNRLTQPSTWKQDYLMPFERFKKLDHVRILQGQITDLDPDEKQVSVTLPDGSQQVENYDVLVIASGVTNGFWRNDAVEDRASIDHEIARVSNQIAGVDSVAIIGGGATGVSVSANLAEHYPDKAIHFFYSQPQPLPGYHAKIRRQLEAHLKSIGVHLHANHRAVVPEGFDCDELTTAAVTWSTGQPPFQADLTLWSVGGTRPNSAFVPDEMLDGEGFVKTNDTLQVPGHPNIFAVGDVAASDPNRSSARNWGYRLVAHNIGAYLAGNDAGMKRYDPPGYRWGSILGVQKNGLRVFQPGGGSFRFPRWSVKNLLFPLAVRKLIYRGVRKAR